MDGLTDNARRDLFLGSLEVLVLAVLADGRQYGYAIQKRLKHTSGQTLKPGTLYPLLHRLEAQGLVHAQSDITTGRERKWYTLTPQGQAKLKAAATDWQATFAQMQALVLPALRQVTRHAPKS